MVDEAAMVGTRKLLRLLDHAERAGAKVVLVGDPCQLPEIDAGGAFKGLAERLEPAMLAENRRQHEPWERAALSAAPRRTTPTKRSTPTRPASASTTRPTPTPLRTSSWTTGMRRVPPESSP